MEYPKFKVCCRCFTFNQAKYITDAMNGFTMQQTTFPFVCTIVDDASTDGEQQVIKQYVEDNFDFSEGSAAFNKETDYAFITYAQHKTNKNCYFAVLYLKENHYSQSKPKMGYLSEWRDMCEYEALCEGDDYWIMPEKLEKQVDYMEKHSCCSLCCHAHRERLVDQFSDVHRYSDNIDECPMDDMIQLGGSFMATNSMLIRLSKYHDKPEWFKMSPVGDMVIMYLLASRGKVCYLNEIMSVYRLSASGSWTERMKKSWRQRNDYFKKDILVHEGFDKWTNFKYHKIIVKKIKTIRRLRFHENKVHILKYLKSKFNLSW